MSVEEEFDLFSGIKLRDEGMGKAADRKRQMLTYARNIADQIAKHDPDLTCDIDRVQFELRKIGMDLGMAAGSVFKDDKWVAVGTRKTERKSSHARNITVWRLKS